MTRGNITYGNNTIESLLTNKPSNTIYVHNSFDNNVLLEM